MASRSRSAAPFEFNGHSISPGSRQQVPLRVGTFLTHEELLLKPTIVHGRKPGPVMLLTAAIHGDEYNGTEIIRRVLRHKRLGRLAGTLIAVPIVNRPGFVTRSRYMPDRRDLNRLFPGSATGPLGSRLAKVLMDQVVGHADVVIDLHTGAVNRPNLPQLRVSTGARRALELAHAFDPPVVLVGRAPEGTFRRACAELGKPVLLYEAGEAMRLDAPSIRFGTEGILLTMEHLGMLATRKHRKKSGKTLVSRRSFWERAPVGGVFTPLVALGKAVEKGTQIGFIADPHGESETPVIASRAGVLIGRTNDAVTDEGDGLFHIAALSDLDQAETEITKSADALPAVTGTDDDHPVPYDSLNDTIS